MQPLPPIYLLPSPRVTPIAALFSLADVCIYGVLMMPIFLAISRRSKLGYAFGTLFSWLLLMENVLEICFSECELYYAAFVSKETKFRLCRQQPL